jgi:glutaminyl-tRNA synthetase
MTSPTQPSPPPNFLRHIIEADLNGDQLRHKRWAGVPGPADVQAQGGLDTARIRTRFPPEPNGYLHLGHAKSIWLNFGLARDYGGACHLRFDDTNPEKEEQEYVDSIMEAVRWLGFDWKADGQDNLYFASDYFHYMYDFAQALVIAGYAYVDEQSADEIRANRGTLTEGGTNSPWRDRPAAESLARLTEMREGKHPDGSMVLRARVDMSSPNINMRDPVMYRVRHASHHRTGSAWCIYPLYSWAHPVEDALEGITHSICTLEFEDQRPYYDWILARLAELGKLAQPLPHQYEFARLNLSYIVTSKRKLLQLVRDGHVDGWDDPRLPTLAGLRRRGYTPASIRLLCDRTGVSKSNTRLDYSLLEQAIRDDLDPIAARSVAVLDPIKLVITNYPAGQTERCTAPRNPHTPNAAHSSSESALDLREFPFSRTLWIERDDFREEAPKKYFRLFPGNTVRLKYGYTVRCTGCTKDEAGNVVEVQAEYLPETKSGTAGADAVKVKGTITWVSAEHAVPARIHLYDRLFTDPHPDAGDKDFIAALNPNSKVTVDAWLEPGTDTTAGNSWQFERLGYFTADAKDSTAANPVINRIVTLRDSWAG